MLTLGQLTGRVVFHASPPHAGSVPFLRLTAWRVVFFNGACLLPHKGIVGIGT